MKSAAVCALLPPILTASALIAFWAYGSGAGLIPKWFLPHPEKIALEFVNNYKVLWKHARVTLIEALSGFGLGAVMGLMSALLMATLPLAKAAFYPYALASRALPLVVFTPIIVILLGRGMQTVILIVAVATYFPIFIALFRGLQKFSAERAELLHSLSATPLQTLWLVRLPSAMPFVFSGLKIGASSAFINAIVIEWLASNEGLGYLVTSSGQFFKLATMWAAIFTTSLMTLALLGTIIVIERIFKRYSSLSAEL